MKMFNTEMHLLTFVFTVAEIIFMSFQFSYMLLKPWDKHRVHFVILLSLLIVYNITGGLFPDPSIPIDIKIQNVLAYATGTLMASYFPYYFYKAYSLDELKFHGKYGVFLFIILPIVVFIGFEYLETGMLDRSVQRAMILPFFYAVFLLYVMLASIKKKYEGISMKSDEFLTYLAVMPWVSMPVVSFFQLEQWIEVVLTNSGFIIISTLFIRKNMKTSWKNEKVLDSLLNKISQVSDDDNGFFQICEKFQFTTREIEIADILRTGSSNKEIANALFISESTVKKHIQNIYRKTSSANKFELINKLENRFSKHELSNILD
ncbi:MAG: helix-turn-helix transcriptional regulator [Olivibacter sp.]|nr:helix-turn-helix transcriptional regulator [Olivibacter sp. UJ_SKK_5.1]